MKNNNDAYFVTTGQTNSYKNYDTVSSFGSILHSKGSTFEPVTDVTVRVPFSRSDYERFRGNELVPSNFADIVKACRSAYQKVSIVRNVIDLMIDFACEDLKISHEDPKAEAFFNVWAHKISLHNVVKEFAKRWFLDSNIVVRRFTAKISKKALEEWNGKVIAKPDLPLIKKDYVDFLNSEIPIKYIFLNICSLSWEDSDDIGGSKDLVFKPSNKFISRINNLKQNLALPKEYINIHEGITKNGSIKLDKNKLYICSNKKDSWEDWSMPYLFSILSDVLFKEKLRQADVSALDGVINVIRLWKLGDHKEKILPNPAIVNKLINILESNTGGGAIDIVWDSLIDMQEFYPPVDKILGSGKYEQVNKDILIGLGIPEVLIGGAGANFSNAWIQLKTVIEKLKDVRSYMIDWLNGEAEIVCKSLGIAKLPRFSFSRTSLEDENTTKKLIVGLLDRGAISLKAVLDIYGEDFAIEMERIRREKESGIETKSPIGVNITNQSQNQGRPVLTNDTTKRKTRKNNVRTSGFVYALDAISAIDEFVIPEYVSSLNISNIRQATAEQKNEINKIRDIVLSCINYGDALTKDNLLKISQSAQSFDTTVINEIKRLTIEHINETKSEPNLNQKKNISALAWVNIKG